MNPLMVIIIILAVISLITFFFVTTYNTLVLLRNRLLADWKQVMLEVNYRYDLTMQFISLVRNDVNPALIKRIVDLDNAHKIIVNPEEVMNNYIDLEKTLFSLFVELEDKGIVHQDWFNAYQGSKQRLDRARDIYNDDVLAMNNKIDLFPFSIVGTIFHFSKQIFFRNEN